VRLAGLHDDRWAGHGGAAIAVIAERMVFCRSDTLFALLECDWCKVANMMHHHNLPIPIASPSFQMHHLASRKIGIWVLGHSTAVSIKLCWLLDGAILLLKMVETLVGGQSGEGGGAGCCSAILGMHDDWVNTDRGTVVMSTGVVGFGVASYAYYAMWGFLFICTAMTNCWSNGG